jgi:hypothetical protein
MHKPVPDEACLVRDSFYVNTSASPGAMPNCKEAPKMTGVESSGFIYAGFPHWHQVTLKTFWQLQPIWFALFDFKSYPLIHLANSYLHGIQSPVLSFPSS